MKKEIVRIDNFTKIFKSKTGRKTSLTFTKNVKVAVNNLSLSIYEGEVFGILGNNGAGKTTLMRAISTLIKPTKGKISVCGLDTVCDSQQVRKKIGFLSSELKLDPVFSPNFLFDFFSNLYGIEKNVSEKRKDYLFDSFGINEFRDVKIEKLSTGMKQKVSLAISLVNSPDIIIFDEPTNGLDISASRTVCEFIKTLKFQGKTIIISSHIFEIIEKLCDRTGIIINGELKLCDDVSALVEGNTIENVFFSKYYGENK